MDNRSPGRGDEVAVARPRSGSCRRPRHKAAVRDRGGRWPVAVSDPTKHRRGGAIGFDVSTVRGAKPVAGRDHDTHVALV
jgi:hypothetical protein